MSQIFKKSGKIFLEKGKRFLCLQKITNPAPNVILKNSLQKSVYVSQSNDIYTNLALETYLYKNLDFSKHHVMMLWRNEPCVVIGRHQNPWLEVNIEYLEKHGIKLARRASGGGTVFQDMGNLNLTFFTSRQKYNRRDNLELIARALYHEWGLKCNITPKHNNLIINKEKISGSAAQVGKKYGYHHCTLLVSLNKNTMRDCLTIKDLGIISNSTKSIQSKTTNLKTLNPDVTIEKLMAAVGHEWLKSVGDINITSKQSKFKFINPTTHFYPEVMKIREDIVSWKWIYGHTPKFKVNLNVPLLLEAESDLTLTMLVENGLINKFLFNIPSEKKVFQYEGTEGFLKELKEQKFDEKTIFALKNLTKTKLTDLRSNN